MLELAFGAGAHLDLVFQLGVGRAQHGEGAGELLVGLEQLALLGNDHTFRDYVTFEGAIEEH